MEEKAIDACLMHECMLLQSLSKNDVDCVESPLIFFFNICDNDTYVLEVVNVESYGQVSLGAYMWDGLDAESLHEVFLNSSTWEVGRVETLLQDNKIVLFFNLGKFLDHK